MKPWGFFILTTFLRFICLVPLLIFCMLLGHVEVSEAFDQPATPMKKRRQQGILTGMPFMANLAPRTFVDDTGRKIYLANIPKRVVSLAPSITEILFAIGAGGSVVGVTEFCDFPPEAKTKPRVGDSRPNLEAILALQPDLVLAVDVIRNDILETLEQLKIPIFVLQANTLEQIYSHIQTLGRMLNRLPEANVIAQHMRKEVMAIGEKTKPLVKPRVLYVVYPEPFITVGPGSFIHQLIEIAGGDNIAKDAGHSYPRLGMEVVVKRDPEILLLPTMGGKSAPGSDLSQWKRWDQMSAVKNERLHYVPWAVISRPGPRVVQGLRALAQVIHPDSFPRSKD